MHISAVFIHQEAKGQHTC